MTNSITFVRKQVVCLVAGALACVFMAPGAYAKPQWLGDFNDAYGTDGSRLDTCGLCHLDFGSGSRNPYGNAFNSAGGPDNPSAGFAAIEAAFSDSDSTNNLDEIMALFMPGVSCDNIGATSNGPADLADYVDPLLPGCVAIDTDGDTVADNLDNCQLVANADQRDTDGDNFGNVCDADLNQDCTANVIDLGIFRTRFFSNDPDADFDGSGAVNVVDLGILRTLFFLAPGPSGLPNACTP